MYDCVTELHDCEGKEKQHNKLTRYVLQTSCCFAPGNSCVVLFLLSLTFIQSYNRTIIQPGSQTAIVIVVVVVVVAVVVVVVVVVVVMVVIVVNN